MLQNQEEVVMDVALVQAHQTTKSLTETLKLVMMTLRADTQHILKISISMKKAVETMLESLTCK